MTRFLVLLAAAMLCAAGILAPEAHTALPVLAWDSEALPLIGFGGLVVNAANLQRLHVGFQTAFQNGLGMAPSHYQQIVTPVPSSTKEEKYGWLGKLPGFREWIGDRVLHNIQVHDYSIKNKDFENTIGVDRNDIQDDTFGIYTPLFTAMGEATAAHPNELTFAHLKTGFTAACYDGQYMFDTDHPVLDANGNVTSVANTDGGAGTPWFLLDLSRYIKPIIFQKRQDYNFIAMDAPTDEAVFNRKLFRYGVDARVNVGFGLWQLAWGSKQTLNKANYRIAREALMGMKGDYGRPLGLRPTHLLVPPTLEGEALEILNAERDAAGATNVYKGTAQLINCPWLA